ncbi:hypothetical protein F511_03292 [Dorcoceras hygrometricum]|uniref:Response regulatory domain-containing protein n=1 Tax=Dorcoceras hygrometricum TaxID=472368 RepID=A0A2Z7BM39_9LAMI|nr:hypothetical protein F511_03292 [Dorcoceras hygrometricum]
MEAPLYCMSDPPKVIETGGGVRSSKNNIGRNFPITHVVLDHITPDVAKTSPCPDLRFYSSPEVNEQVSLGYYGLQAVCMQQQTSEGTGNISDETPLMLSVMEAVGSRDVRPSGARVPMVGPQINHDVIDMLTLGLMYSGTDDSVPRNLGEDHDQKRHGFHVLAVDDSRLDRKLLERLLTLSSYQVTFVDSGDKALEYLGLIDDINEENIVQYQRSSSSPRSSLQDKVSKINLIMTDYSMPGISGYDLLKRVKDSSWRDIPVVVMSSENLPSRINMCLEGGAVEFLLKPVKLSDLRKLHSHLLNSYRQKEEKDDTYKDKTTL